MSIKFNFEVMYQSVNECPILSELTYYVIKVNAQKKKINKMKMNSKLKI